MKLKELPRSIYQSLYLKSLSVDQLLKTPKKEVPVIISLTTIPTRIDKVYITLRSILNQSVRPFKLILWLPDTIKSSIPDTLRKLESAVFEIDFTHLTCSHKKLIHTLKKYPEYPVITADDDLIYDPLWIEKLYTQHEKFPNTIIANQTRKISYNTNNQLLPYPKWTYQSTSELNDFNVLGIGASGILYPPHCFTEQVFDENLFLKLCPKADDLWFKAMAIINNTPTMMSQDIPNPPIPILGTQKVSLKKENIGKHKNVDQWNALQQYFKIDPNILQV